MCYQHYLLQRYLLISNSGNVPQDLSEKNETKNQTGSPVNRSNGDSGGNCGPVITRSFKHKYGFKPSRRGVTDKTAG